MLSPLLKNKKIELNKARKQHFVWFIEAHQFRIAAQANRHGRPTPEGIHRDGVDYVSITCINRHNVKGGVSQIYDLNKNLITEIKLKPLQTLLLNDREVMHAVNEISQKKEQHLGIREYVGSYFPKRKVSSEHINN